MRIVYGNTFFPVSGSTCSTRTEIVRSANGRPIRYRVYLDCEASYIAPPGQGTAALSVWENTVRAALAVPYQNLYLADDNGLATAARLTNSDSISGVVITDGPHFPERVTPEWVKVRTVRFSGVAEYVLRGTENIPLSWQQSVSVTGNGGPTRRWRVPVNDRFKPVRQRITPFSIIRLVQSGVATGHLVYPPAPAMLWPADLLVNEEEAVTQESGQPLGRAFVGNVTRWNYKFENTEFLPAAMVTPIL